MKTKRRRRFVEKTPYIMYDRKLKKFIPNFKRKQNEVQEEDDSSKCEQELIFDKERYDEMVNEFNMVEVKNIYPPEFETDNKKMFRHLVSRCGNIHKLELIHDNEGNRNKLSKCISGIELLVVHKFAESITYKEFNDLVNYLIGCKFNNYGDVFCISTQDEFIEFNKLIVKFMRQYHVNPGQCINIEFQSNSNLFNFGSKLKTIIYYFVSSTGSIHKIGFTDRTDPNVRLNECRISTGINFILVKYYVGYFTIQAHETKLMRYLKQYFCTINRSKEYFKIGNSDEHHKFSLAFDMFFEHINPIYILNRVVVNHDVQFTAKIRKRKTPYKYFESLCTRDKYCISDVNDSEICDHIFCKEYYSESSDWYF